MPGDVQRSPAFLDMEITETKQNLKGRQFQIAVIVVGLLLWFLMAGGTIAFQPWKDLLILLAAVPLIIIVGLCPIIFPLPKSNQEFVAFTLIDAFVLVLAGWYGIAPAVMVAGIEAFSSSRRNVRRLSSNLFSAGMMSLTAAITSFVLTAVLRDGWLGGRIARSHSISAVAAALLVASIIQVTVNWGFICTFFALRHDDGILKLWKQNFASLAPLFLPTSVAATLIYFAVQNGTLVMTAIGGPVLLAIYFSHRQNRVRAEQAAGAERERAEEAERHVAELSRYIAEQERILEKFTQIEKLSAIGELASGVAHDFNNTLAGILGRAQLLQAHSKDAKEVERGLEIIIKTAKDGAKTVKRIQDFARQRRDYDFEPIAVDQLLLDVSEITRPRWKDGAEAANVYIALELRLNTKALVMGDASELREVMVNMIFNAVDAMPTGGNITLSAAEIDGQVTIGITDTGAGMTEEVRSKVFDPFFTTKGKAGMGLGLAVSYGIICRHEGTVDVESAVGQGTRFLIKLPVTRKALVGLSGDAKIKQVAPGSEPQVRILVVDDESFIRELLRDILESEGHLVAEAEDGFQALALFASESFDAVFTDIGMPGMSGWDLARAIRERNVDIPLAVLTGWGEAVSSHERKTAAVNWVVSKPFDVNRVVEILKEISLLQTEKMKSQRQLTLVA
jgi:signal transduction histidine kinase/CheY-like chemotaxis protein